MNKLKPGWNGYQYLFTFFVGVLGDMIVHFFSSRKYFALKAGRGDEVYGFAPSLMPYYHSLRNLYPFKNTGYETVETFNTWFWGGIFGGVACMIALLGADIILQIIDIVEESKGK